MERDMMRFRHWVGALGATLTVLGVGAPSASAASCSPAVSPPSETSTSYAFEATRGDGTPMRWSLCAPIHWKLSAADAPAGALATLKADFASVHRATGLRFIYDGTTSKRAAGYLDTITARGRWKPVLVDFVPPGDPQLCGTGGCTQNRWWNDVMVAGTIVLNDTLARGWSQPGSVGSIGLHELGHLVGLDHVSDTTQVMYPVLQTAFTAYAAGDRNGLWRVGAGSPQLSQPKPGAPGAAPIVGGMRAG
jgi:hypothetical protein